MKVRKREEEKFKGCFIQVKRIRKYRSKEFPQPHVRVILSMILQEISFIFIFLVLEIIFIVKSIGQVFLYHKLLL